MYASLFSLSDNNYFRLLAEIYHEKHNANASPRSVPTTGATWVKSLMSDPRRLTLCADPGGRQCGDPKD